MQDWNDVAESTARSREAGLESVLALGRIATRTQGLFARQQLLALERCLESGHQQLSLAGAAREPAEYFARQSEIARSLGEELVAMARQSYEIGVQARDEFAHWAEQGVNAISEAAAVVPETVKASVRPAAAKPVATTPAGAKPARTRRAPRKTS